MTVSEMFFAVQVRDMARATEFYVRALGAEVKAAVPFWSSLHIAGVRLGLSLDPAYAGGQTGLHFAVDDLPRACAEVEAAGGRAAPPVEVVPGIVLALATDSEGNTFTFIRR